MNFFEKIVASYIKNIGRKHKNTIKGRKKK